MARSAAVAGISSVLLLVFREVIGVAFRFHLGPGHVAAHSSGPDDEFCLEVHVADGVHLSRFGCGVVLQWSTSGGMALVVCNHCGRLRRALVVFGYAEEIQAADLSLRRMSTVAFTIIAVFTLAFALAAATNP